MDWVCLPFFEIQIKWYFLSFQYYYLFFTNNLDTIIQVQLYLYTVSWTFIT